MPSNSISGTVYQLDFFGCKPQKLILATLRKKWELLEKFREFQNEAKKSSLE